MGKTYGYLCRFHSYRDYFTTIQQPPHPPPPPPLPPPVPPTTRCRHGMNTPARLWFCDDQGDWALYEVEIVSVAPSGVVRARYADGSHETVTPDQFDDRFDQPPTFVPTAGISTLKRARRAERRARPTTEGVVAACVDPGANPPLVDIDAPVLAGSRGTTTAARQCLGPNRSVDSALELSRLYLTRLQGFAPGMSPSLAVVSRRSSIWLGLSAIEIFRLDGSCAASRPVIFGRLRMAMLATRVLLSTRPDEWERSVQRVLFLWDRHRSRLTGLRVTNLELALPVTERASALVRFNRPRHYLYRRRCYRCGEDPQRSLIIRRPTPRSPSRLRSEDEFYRVFDRVNICQACYEDESASCSLVTFARATGLFGRQVASASCINALYGPIGSSAKGRLFPMVRRVIAHIDPPWRSVPRPSHPLQAALRAVARLRHSVSHKLGDLSDSSHRTAARLCGMYAALNRRRAPDDSLRARGLLRHRAAELEVELDSDYIEFRRLRKLGAAVGLSSRHFSVAGSYREVRTVQVRTR
mmetsp:Transcript_49185/g.139355  ORF Transcript_49185/g.139355 Transcript_49185/m.139355 type:complete len:526 (-) Transcript_49185:305-1882(-)